MPPTEPEGNGPSVGVQAAGPLALPLAGLFITSAAQSLLHFQGQNKPQGLGHRDLMRWPHHHPVGKLRQEARSPIETQGAGLEESTRGPLRAMLTPALPVTLTRVSVEHRGG